MHALEPKGRREPPYVFAVVAILCLGLGEWYPFTDYPMFSDLPNHAWHIHVTDGENRPIPGRQTFGRTVMSMRRLAKTHLEKLNHEAPTLSALAREQAVGRYLVGRILADRERMAEPPPLPEEIRIWRTRLYQRDGEIVRERELLAKAEVP